MLTEYLWDTVSEVQDILANMTPDERVEFIRELFAGYCIHCGSHGSGHCHCQNDE